MTNYVIFGVSAFIISFLVFALLEQLTSLDWATANIIAWIAATIFGYYTNRSYVFHSHHEKFIAEAIEMARFFLGRGFTLIAEQLILWIGIRLLGIYALVVKLLAQIIVTILNYIISKFLVFKQKETKNGK
ncbi:GtrA family protein [Oenococcus sicerae]|nr:GtrA family protein [Oenococcus sicerae]